MPIHPPRKLVSGKRAIEIRAAPARIVFFGLELAHFRKFVVFPVNKDKTGDSWVPFRRFQIVLDGLRIGEALSLNARRLRELYCGSS